jgi:pseudaminic acid cytidylyltransferase
MRLAVIPARGGSKRIPRKNIKMFCGKPMIAWSIHAAIESGCFDRVVVSTDDYEIAAVAKEFGAEVPFLRPASLSGDFSGTTEVIAHATKWLIDQGAKVSDVCCIYATAPLMQIDDIKMAKQILETGLWEYVFSAFEQNSQVFRSFSINKSGSLEMIFPQYFKTRTQDLPMVLQDAAQFYWGKPSAWLNQKKIFDNYSTFLKLPSWRVQDIDSQADWEKAELIFNKIKCNSIK